VIREKNYRDRDSTKDKGGSESRLRVRKNPVNRGIVVILIVICHWTD